MKRLISLFLLALAISPVAVFASNVSDAEYSGTIIVSNNSTLAQYVSANVDISSPSLITAGILNTAATNAAIQGSSGSDLAFMPGYLTNPLILFTDSVSAYGNYQAHLYTGNVTGGVIRYFPGSTGLNVPYSALMEPSNTFTLGLYGAFVNTSSSTSQIISEKANRFQLLSTPGGNFTASILAPTCLDYDPAASSNVTVPDHNDFSFTDGAGNDLPATITWWMNTTNFTTQYIIAKAKYPKQSEFYIDKSTVIRFFLTGYPSAPYIGRQSTSISGYSGSWIFCAATYDGSETSNGIHLYINGAIADGSALTSGSYTGITNGTSNFNIGASSYNSVNKYDGNLAEISIYKNRCFSAAEVLNAYQGYQSSTGRVGYWKMSTGSGNTLADYSGYGHTGTIYAADWIAMYAFIPNHGFDISTGATFATGEHDIEVKADTVNAWLVVDGVNYGTKALAGATINATASSWYIGKNSIVPYYYEARFYKSGTLNGDWVWEYGATFSDHSGHGMTATPSYRTTCSDADVTATLSNFLPTDEAEADYNPDLDWPSMVATAPDQPATAYSENSSPGVFFAGLIHSIWPKSGVPESFFWYNFTFATIIIAGILSFRIHPSLLLKIIVATAIMIFWALPGPNVYGMFVVIYKGLYCFGILVLSKHYGW